MAARATFHVNVANDLRGYILLLKSVICEWLLIFFLLLDAIFLFFLTKFAKRCSLQSPCMICSRLDHILGDENPDFYKDLICNDHRSKLSSLVFCHIHGSLADVHDICEECLLSFAMKKDSSPEIYKFLIGKLGLDGLRNPMSEKDFFHGFVSLKCCTCCNKQWRCRPNVQKLMKTQSFGSRVSKPGNIPLPAPPSSSKYLNRRDAVKPRDRVSVTTTPLFLGYPEGYNGQNVSDHLDQRAASNFSKERFEDWFRTKQVGLDSTKMAMDARLPQPSPLKKPATSLRDSAFEEKPLHSTSSVLDLPVSRDIRQKATSPKPSVHQDGADDKVVGDFDSWESCDLVTPKNKGVEFGVDLGVENDDKKDGITLPDLHVTNAMASEQLPRTEQDRIDRSTFEGDKFEDKDDAPFSFKSMAGDKSDSPFIFKMNDNKSDSPFRIKVEGYVDEPFELKLQAEEDRRRIDRLRKELEEERSASAEAANQAMAMITKLQEEKAVLNMDALQYLRMMEEQAEHDMETLERTNDLLTEKEKEIQDLEAELEFYRLKYPDEYEQEFAQVEGLNNSKKDNLVAEIAKMDYKEARTGGD